MQIAYFEWVDEELPQARVQVCHQLLRAFLVTGGCEARSNAQGEVSSQNGTGLGEERTGERE